MKTIKIVLVLIGLCFTGSTNAQFLKKLKKKAERAVERTIERRVEKETSEKTDEVLDSILEPGTKRKNPTHRDGNPTSKGEGSGDNRGDKPVISAEESGIKNISVYSKFDFVPGEEILFFDDFTNVALGDFPAHWDTNGSGEAVDFNEDRWFKMTNKSTYIPDIPGTLPEAYSIEFDMYAPNISNNGSQARSWFWVADNKTFKNSRDWAGFNLDFWDQLPTGLRINNYLNGERVINNNIKQDLRTTLKRPVRISIAVNKKRFRFWVDEKKIIDVPRLVPEAPMSAFKMRLEGFQESLLINNFRVAAGGQDLRAQLINKGRFSTTGIHFDPGSDEIRPESYGALKHIAQALKQDGFHINIVGHTDNNGDEDMNQSLSEKRAENVKLALVSLFEVDGSLITSEGKGESEPIAENDSPEGQAQNRRVEFIKLQ